MDYRVLETVPEFEQAAALEIAVWGIDPRDSVPVNLLRAIQHAGGLILGAYDGERIIGVALAFPARSEDDWVLWSHLTGVDRAYQGRGIGFAIKQQQREWALANGFEQICWTFDPLQRGNAHFNLRMLGATASRYHEDFYGMMVDEINRADLPSDRVEAVWRLRDSRVEYAELARPALLASRSGDAVAEYAGYPSAGASGADTAPPRSTTRRGRADRVALCPARSAHPRLRVRLLRRRFHTRERLFAPSLSFTLRIFALDEF